MVTEKNTYYVVKLGAFESVFSTRDLVGLNMFWDAFWDSWYLAGRESDYVDTLASLCPNADTVSLLRFSTFTQALEIVKKDYGLFNRLCIAAASVYREYCDSSVDSFISGAFTAEDLATQIRDRGEYVAIYPSRASLSAGDLASLWSDGDLPAALESELESCGVALAEDGDSVVIK